MAREEFDWARFDTDAHKAAQAACMCWIRCAVDGPTRSAVARQLDIERRLVTPAVPLLVAQLTGRCCLPPADAPTPTV